MPKTIHSQRDPLTVQELKAYTQNKQTLKEFRDELKGEVKGLNYVKIFTEARAKGGCRSKFWLMPKSYVEKSLQFLKRCHAQGKYLNVTGEHYDLRFAGGLVIRVS